MDNRRRLIRLNVGDFLELRPLHEVARVHTARTRDFTLMGICFSCEMEWEKGQVLVIDYFIPDELDSVKLKIVVIWSEFIDSQKGYFCGGEIIEVEEAKQEKFANYYFRRLQERFLK
jgi:hypothetical protein